MRISPLAPALAATLSAVSLPGVSLAETVLPTIVVTPERFPDAPDARAANVTVITRAELDANPADTLPDLLADYAGVAVRDLFGNHASNATVDLRGFGAAAGQNVLILIDGRRLTDIDLSGVVWSAIPVSAIERIEIVRGGASVLHGAGAVGGVINLVTRSPLNRVGSGGVALRAGSFDTREAQAHGAFGNATLGLALAASTHRSDGWRDNNANQQDSVYGDLRFKSGDSETSFTFGADDQDIRLPGARTVQPSIGLDQLQTDPRGTSTPNDYASRTGWQAGLSSLMRLGAHEVIVDAGYRDKQQVSYFDFGGFPDARDAELTVATFSPRARFALGAHALTVGVDLQRWDYELVTSNAIASLATPINRVSARQRNSALYASNVWQVRDDLTLNAGARVEKFSLDARDVFDPTAPSNFPGSGAGAGSQDEREHAWEIGARWQAAPEHALYAKAGRSFRFATVDELYEFSPSFDREFQFLQPQTAHDVEAGWEFRRAAFASRAALYAMRVEDEIHLDPYGFGVGNTNLPPLERVGVELEARTDFGAIDVGGAYTYARARFTGGNYGGVELDGNDVPLVSRHKLALNLGWQLHDRTRLALSVNAQSSARLDNDEPNTAPGRVPGFAVADLKLEHRVGAWAFAAAVNNLTDRDYFTYGVNSTFTPDRYNAYPLPGRHGWVSVGYDFE